MMNLFKCKNRGIDEMRLRQLNTSADTEERRWDQPSVRINGRATGEREKIDGD
jgi:hypothetical protein